MRHKVGSGPALPSYNELGPPTSISNPIKTTTQDSQADLIWADPQLRHSS